MEASFCYFLAASGSLRDRPCLYQSIGSTSFKRPCSSCTAWPSLVSSLSCEWSSQYVSLLWSIVLPECLQVVSIWPFSLIGSHWWLAVPYWTHWWRSLCPDSQISDQSIPSMCLSLSIPSSHQSMFCVRDLASVRYTHAGNCCLLSLHLMARRRTVAH